MYGEDRLKDGGFHKLEFCGLWRTTSLPEADKARSGNSEDVGTVEVDLQKLLGV